MTNAAPIACGIAGWSYPDWEGYVYPRGTRDKLRYAAGFFDVIEINSTFYRPPDPPTAHAWLRRTHDIEGFGFAAKLHREITHEGHVDPEMTRRFQQAFGPMIDEGRLRHLLAQFRYDFNDRPDTRDHLKRIRDAYGGLTNLTLELRHRSWQTPDAIEFLRTLDVSVANLDYPTAHDSFDLRVTGIGDHAYFRLHGRNTKVWFSKSAGRDETYNYLYNPAELSAIAERARSIGALSKSLTLVANNHYRGKEAANALELKAMLSGERVDVPPPLLTHYPELKRIANPTGELL